jgi:polygalacturonase
VTNPAPAPAIDRRSLIATGALAAAGIATRAGAAGRPLDIRDFGAIGDGRTLATTALQRAIDAAAPGGCVLVPAGLRFVTGPVTLKGGIELRVDGTLLASTRAEDYADPLAGLLHANGATGLTISGTGTIDGQSPAFMERYDAAGEWYVPKPFRPRLLVLEDCAGLTIRDLTLARAPFWTVHMIGCRKVLIERIRIDNQLDVPNCDGIDPDHCQDVVIRNCHIRCGDDAIVVKTTRGHERYGPSRAIHVHDCVLETQDAGLKIGTETVQDIHDVLFERCEIVTSSRGLCIQLRDEGNVYGITFRDIRFTARHYSAPWWGRGEAISFTAIPRDPATRVGTLHHITVERVTGRAENSERIEGSAGARAHDITFRQVAVTLGRRTRYPGGVFDNRPTSAVAAEEPHDTPGFFLRHVDRVVLDRCRVAWDRPGVGFSNAVQAVDVTGLTLPGFAGGAAHAGMTAVVQE